MKIPKITGNKGVAYVLVVVFILLLLLFFWGSPAKSAEAVVRAGSSVGPGGLGPVAGLDVRQKIGPSMYGYAGTTLWGSTATTDPNWDWHAGFRGCRWAFCASIAFSYIQKLDAGNGTHTNMGLGLTYVLNWHRVDQVGFYHVSNAGTSANNRGRNAVLVDFRFQ